MTKRKSEEPLDSSLAESLASKRARVEDEDDARAPDVPASVPEEAEDGFEEDEEDSVAPLRQDAPLQGYSDLYLDTVNRSVLDFDFEKLCSITLSNINVYACLVCGRYFQGRGPKSHAYFHALDEDHHVYINLETKKVYILPEGYEVQNKSLDDIKYVADPKFTEADVKQLDKVPTESVDLHNKRYRPGYIGINNIKANDYINVVIQTLAHIPPLRNFFLLHAFPTLETTTITTPQLPIRLSTLIRKIWNPKAFRNHVSPHELIQEISTRSNKRFTLTNQSDPVDFLSWFLNTLHFSLGGSRTKPHSSIIQRTFQGRLRIESQSINTSTSTPTNTTNKTIPYTILTLDLPPTPLFRPPSQSQTRSTIPQIPLTTLLQKYNGLHPSETSTARTTHRLQHPLPPYLIFHIKRFSANKFVAERNPTIVTFPSPRGLDMSPFVEPNPTFHAPGEPILYEMVSNIILDAATGRGGEDSNAADAANHAVGGEGERVHWKVQVRDKAATGSREGTEWREIQDLFVERAEAETLFTREGYLMVWERKKMSKGSAKGAVNGDAKGKQAQR